MGTLLHLVTRFFGSLSPLPLSAEDDVWVRRHLNDGEQALWRQMSRADRKHAAGVARGVAELLGDQATRPVLAAAALHDVGKLDAGLGTVGRALATILHGLAGRERVRSWRPRNGFRRRCALYLDHPRLGGDRLALAEADPLTVAWAREHHRPTEDWTVPRHLADALKAADDD